MFGVAKFGVAELGDAGLDVELLRIVDLGVP